MKNRILFLLTALLMLCTSARADWNFRAHRYDSWKVLPVTSESIVFVGNSITDMQGWTEAFQNDPRVINRGNSGGLSDEVLNNVYGWVWGKPAKVFIKIGTNDLGSNIQESAIYANIRTTVEIIRTFSPNTEIYLQSIIPAKDQNYKTLTTIQAANKRIKSICDNTDHCTYVDLYSKLGGILSGAPYSLDNLHLEAYGYQIWCNAIKEYVGIDPVFPTNTNTIQATGGLGSAHGMRATYFSVFPTTSNDVLFFGDEMVKNGEWNELLQNRNIKNRGTGWGYGGSIDVTSKIVEASFANAGKVQRDKPARILLYTGTEDVNKNDPNAESNYKALISKLHTKAPGVQIGIVSLMPTSNTNAQVKDFNTKLKAIAQSDALVDYIDIYSVLVNASGALNTAYLTNDYLYGDGYIKVAGILADYLGEGFTAITTAQANANKAKFTSTQNEVADLLAAKYANPSEEAVYTLQCNRGGRFVTSQGAGNNLLGTTNESGTGYWRFKKRSDGKYDIVNYEDNTFISAVGITTGKEMKSVSSSPSAGWEIKKSADAGWFILVGGTNQFNQSTNAPYPVLNWGGGNNTTDQGCKYQICEVPNTPCEISVTNVQQGKVTTGIGNRNEGIVRSTIIVSGLTGDLTLTGVKGKVVASQLSDVKAIRAYFATNERELFIDADKKMTWREENGTLYGEGTIDANGNYVITGNKRLTTGTYYLWIAFDISESAKEGNTVDATITEYQCGENTIAEPNGNPNHAATIFLTESSVLMPQDKGSLYYRIPSICTSADGKRLVTLTDDRKNHNGDLPSHCYIVAQYSEDNGRTWSNPKTVAGTASTGGDYGHGDASLVTNRITGRITGIMTSSAYGTGFFQSTVDKPQTWKTIYSDDGGITWSTPKDFTKSLYAAGSPNPNWKAGFSGSGAALQKRDGTLVSSFVNKETDNSQNFYFFMSKDDGATWKTVGTSGTKGADEPKTLERNNGDLAISVRSGGFNIHNVTSDDGATWKNASGTKFTSGISGNACDGEYMVWCSTLDGNAQDIAFQTAPNSGSREKVSIALSTDEGETFLTPKVICPRGSAYSAATVLPDGTLGVYYEENGLYGGYTMRFVRFSLDWASNGKYKFTEEKPFYPVQTKVDFTVPSWGAQSIVLPWKASIPDAFTVYECTSDTLRFNENGQTYTGIMLKKFEGTEFEAFHPYVVMAEPATYTFERPLADWQAQPMPKDCKADVAPLVGCLTKKVVVGNGTTAYSSPRNATDKSGLAFNRITKNSRMTIAANTAHLSMDNDANGPAFMRILTDNPTAIHDVNALRTQEGDLMFDLNGRRIMSVPSGIVIKSGKKVIK
ncbi:MAG: exo-alpha-sialidase [Bacteroidales bacterium]|nr:exo-alpha-sialidase [Candidatus Physcousia equi]